MFKKIVRGFYHHSLVRFLFVGAFCLVIQQGILYLLRPSLPDATANWIGFVVSAQVNFVLSYKFTYRAQDVGRLKSWALFNLMVLLASGANYMLFLLGSHVIGLQVFIASFVATVVTSVATYLIGKYGIFGRRTSVEFVPYVVPELDPALRDGVAFFMPAYNEAKNLLVVVPDALVYLKSRKEPFALIVVDDGSTDNTQEVMRQFQRKNPEVQYIRHDKNETYGGALRTGIKAGLETGMGWVTFCDSDGQFHPEDVEKLLVAASDSNADMAIGYRIARADDLKRKLMGRGWYYVARMTLWFKATKDVDCGFKLFRSQALLDYGYQLTGNHATISPEILARAYRAGHKIVEVGITHYPRKHGTQTGANLKVIFGSFMELLRVQKTLPSLTARKA